MKAIHFGAGNIGRGFIGNVLHDNGFEIVFVDTNQDLIDQLNKDQGYTIELLDETHSQIWINEISAINGVTEVDKIIDLIVECDIITTSVGANNINHISPVIKEGLIERAKKNMSINILANENVINASDLLKEEIKGICNPEEWEAVNKISYFVNTAIDRQALSKINDGKQIALVEPYYEWVIDQTALDPTSSYELSHVKIVEDMLPYIERKLYLVNAEHAAFAYLGALLNYATVQEAINDLRINKLVRQFMSENMRYFITQYGLDKISLQDFIEQTIRRHGNSVVSDDVSRVGRSPLRKLSHDDRLIAPVMKLEELNCMNEAGKRVVVAAYLYKNENDEEAIKMNQLISDVGITEAIKEISQVPTELATELARLYEHVINNVDNIFL